MIRNLPQKSQRGSLQLLIIIALVGIVFVLALASSAPFKNSPLTKIFPKPSSYATGGHGQRVTLEGTLERIHFDDLPNQRSQEELFLKTKTGEKLRLKFPDKGPALLGGSKVRITGEKFENTVTMASSGGSDVTTITTQTVASLSGERKVAVILFNFTDDTSQPFSAAYAKETVFTAPSSIKNFYQRNSYGQLNLVGNINADGDVFGWVTINMAKGTGCAYSLWGQAADEAITATGVDLSAYNHIIYSFPQANCPFGGISQLPGSRSWNQGQLNTATHELGHNFSLAHANGYQCTDAYGFVASLGNCGSAEYGDAFDVMGSLGGDLNAYHKEQLNWLAQSDIQNVTTSGDYTIQALTENTGVRAIKIPQSISHKTVYNYYYLEYRPPTSPTAPIFNGVLLHVGGSLSANPNLVDTTPETGYVVHFGDAPLSVGRTFIDANNSLTITPVSETSTQAKFHVTFGRTSSSADDALCVSNTSPQGVLPGTVFPATITMKNTGTTTWVASDYQLSSLSNPDGIWGTDKLTLNADVPPGASATFSSSFTSPQVTAFSLPQGFSWRMRKVSTSNWFGQACIKPVAVNQDAAIYDVGQIQPQVSGLTTTTVGSNSVTLSWSPAIFSNPYANVWGYQILRTTGTTTYLAKVVNSTPTTFTDSGLKSNTFYTYSVVTIMGDGLTSPPSQSITVKTTR
jgi:hypothetical protein